MKRLKTNSRNFKKIVWAASVLMLLLLWPKQYAEAHFVETDGPIGAVLHVDPDDDPILGQPAAFFFAFNDQEKKFTSATCSCVARILLNNQELARYEFGGSVPSPSLTSPSFSYTFSKPGEYFIEATGKPISGASFHPFNLQFDLSVSRLPGTAAKVHHGILHYLTDYGFSGVVVIVFIVLGAQGRLTFQQPKAPKPKQSPKA